MSLTSRIQALTAYANEVTGKSDATLSDAVASLADGYGGGGEVDYDDVTLPSEYQRVEYIQSSGSQYIEIPIGFYPTDTIHTVLSINLGQSTDKYMVAPKTWNNNNNRFCIGGIGSSNNYCIGYGSHVTSNTKLAVYLTNDGQLHEWIYSDHIYLVKDLTVCCGVGTATFGTETDNIRLFFGARDNTSGKIRYYVHKKANNTGIALYACYRKSDGVIGMYDTINNVFYINNGIGSFDKGSDI